MDNLISISDVRKITGEPAHRIAYALDRYGPEPAGRVGITRVWSREALPEIQESLRKTAEKSTLADRREAVTG